MITVNAIHICICALALLTSSVMAAERPIIVIPITGEIEEGLAAFVQRGIREAENKNAHAVIIHMDTFGGKLTAAESIMQTLSRATVPVYTFVDTKAISAGALIAAASHRIYMAPQSQIGDAKIMQVSVIPGMGAQEVDEGAKEKVYSAVRAMVRSACERHGHPWPLFEAMMDESIAITNVIEEGRLLTMTSAEAVSNNLAIAVVGSLVQLKEEIGFPDAQLITLTPHSGERMARFLTSMTVSGFLLILGLGGLFIEARTPGVGIPGIIGIICLALFFWGHTIAGMSGWLHIALFVVGIILILLEIFVIPGFGVAGISGIICVFLALIFTMMDWQFGEWQNLPSMTDFARPLFTLTIGIVGAGVLLALATKIIPQTPYINTLFLSKEMTHNEGYTVRDIATISQWMGRIGVAKTALRPAGKAVIDDTLLDVVTSGEWIQAGTPVKVVDTHYNRIVVVPTDATAPTEQA